MPIFPLRTAAFALLAAASPVACRAELRVAQPEAIRAVVKMVPPDYNPIARQLRVQGEVEVEAVISGAGEVTGVRVLHGNALLTAAAVKAVRQWRFQPFRENGKPAPAVATLKFAFKP